VRHWFRKGCCPSLRAVAKRICKGKTKRGTRCKSTAVLANGRCMAHQSEDEKEARGFGGSQPNSGPKKRPRATDLQRAVVEAAAEKLLEPYMRALGLEVDWHYDEDGRPVPQVTVTGRGGLVVHGESKDGDIIVSDHEDLKGQIDIVEKMFDRVFGRPKQTQEIAGAGGGPVRIEVPRSAERASEVARILAGAGALPSSSPHEGRRRSAAPVPAKASPPNGNGSH
jgi:hypothetical protein